MADLRLDFEPLSSRHDREAFSSGNEALDSYLKRQASQDMRRDVARTVVAVARGSSAVAGYYTLGAFAIALDSIPPDYARKLPRYRNIPAALIGRLARDVRYRGQGVGELLLAHAIKRVVDADVRMAVYAVVVDAIDDRAAAFYRSFGFVASAAEPSRLFLPTATARKLFG